MKLSTYIPSSAKDKNECWRKWFEISKRKKTINMKMKKQMFDKQMFAGPGRNNGTEKF